MKEKALKLFNKAELKSIFSSLRRTELKNKAFPHKF
jgi:hypothetical protein